MYTVSGLIERFLMDMLTEREVYHFNRGELAQRFECAPSQINYVLSTRFTTDRGYSITSKRGGGGYVTLVRLSPDTATVIDAVRGGAEMSAVRTEQILELLVRLGHMTRREAAVALAAAEAVETDETRADILENIVLTVMGERE